MTCRRSDVMSKGKKRSGARPGRPQPLRGTKGKRKGARLYARSEERFSRNAETEIYTLSLHDALPIWSDVMSKGKKRSGARPGRPQPLRGTKGKRKGARLYA